MPRVLWRWSVSCGGAIGTKRGASSAVASLKRAVGAGCCGFKVLAVLRVGAMAPLVAPTFDDEGRCVTWCAFGVVSGRVAGVGWVKTDGFWM